MGLPIWREPPRKPTRREKFERLKAAERAAEAEACARAGRVSHGGIRRRAWTSRAGGQRARPGGPVSVSSLDAQTLFDGVIESGRVAQDARLPPIPTLLETTDRPAARADDTSAREVDSARTSDGQTLIEELSLGNGAVRVVIERSGNGRNIPPALSGTERSRMQSLFESGLGLPLAHTDTFDRNDDERARRRSQASRTQRSVVEDRYRLIAETSNTLARLDASSLPPPSAYDAPSPDNAQRRLRRARSISDFITQDNDVQAVPPRTVDGLGDRNRSPTPAEAWEVIRSTIRPDSRLPSTESSFTSAVASQSFSASNPSTVITRANDTNSSSESDDDSASSIDLAEVCADEEDLSRYDTSDQLARDMYYSEMETLEGRQRIAEQEEIRAREGNRFALVDEAAIVDIGFRLIEAALERVEDRHRTLRLRGQAHRTADYGPDLTRLSNAIDVHRARQNSVREAATEVSTDAPVAHPVGLPSPSEQAEQFVAPSEEEVIDRVNHDEQDLGAMRHIIESLASREDIPAEWWTGMGLNLSRSRPRRARDTTQVAMRESRVETELGRVHSGRIERERPTRDERGSRL